ncbi:MAG: MFS family permease [Candidatus Poriferisodalaceae bacterium]
MTEHVSDATYKWQAFGAIGLSFVTNVMTMSMIYVMLESISEDFGVSLRTVTWVVIVEALVISSLMLPMGRVADAIGRKRIHLWGLAIFGVGAVFVGLAPTFPILIAARVVMATGNAMGQSVGTAMVVAVFPPEERGKAIGSQTTAVSIGGASGPILGGLLLEVVSWQTIFLMLLLPVAVAFVASYRVLDESRVSDLSAGEPTDFDWRGAALSAFGVSLLVLTINNPFGWSWVSPLIIAGGVGAILLLRSFVRWELRCDVPMLDLSLFSSRLFSMSILARLLGFMGSTAIRLLVPIYLISLRGLSEGAAGGVLFLISLGMGLAAQGSGRLSDKFGTWRFMVAGFVVMLFSVGGFLSFGLTTPIWLVAIVVFVSGLSQGLWNVPNNAAIFGAAPPNRYGVVGALTNLSRNIGNVLGQALSTAVVVGVMVARGFDVALNEIADSPGASEAFVLGWRAAFAVVIGLLLAALALAVAANPVRLKAAAGTQP